MSVHYPACDLPWVSSGTTSDMMVDNKKRGGSKRCTHAHYGSWRRALCGYVWLIRLLARLDDAKSPEEANHCTAKALFRTPVQTLLSDSWHPSWRGLLDDKPCKWTLIRHFKPYYSDTRDWPLHWDSYFTRNLWGLTNIYTKAQEQHRKYKSTKIIIQPLVVIATHNM